MGYDNPSEDLKRGPIETTNHHKRGAGFEPTIQNFGLSAALPRTAPNRWERFRERGTPFFPSEVVRSHWSSSPRRPKRGKQLPNKPPAQQDPHWYVLLVFGPDHVDLLERYRQGVRRTDEIVGAPTVIVAGGAPRASGLAFLEAIGVPGFKTAEEEWKKIADHFGGDIEAARAFEDAAIEFFELAPEDLPVIIGLPPRLPSTKEAPDHTYPAPVVEKLGPVLRSGKPDRHAFIACVESGFEASRVTEVFEQTAAGDSGWSEATSVLLSELQLNIGRLELEGKPAIPNQTDRDILKLLVAVYPNRLSEKKIRASLGRPNPLSANLARLSDSGHINNVKGLGGYAATLRGRTARIG